MAVIRPADMAELADAIDLGSIVNRRAGSSPVIRTTAVDRVGSAKLHAHPFVLIYVEECGMPNLFKAAEKLSDDELRTEIAVLRSVSLSSAAAETGTRVIGTLAKWANMLVSSANNDGEGRFDYKVVTVVDRIKQQSEQMASMSRAELNERLMHEVYNKCRELDSSVIPEAMDVDTLSVWITREAGKVFAERDDISPANMCVSIKDKYHEQMLARLHRELAAQTPQQIKEADKKIQMALNKVPIEMMRELARTVRPTEFSGAGLGKTIRHENGTQKLAMVVTAMGFEPFDEMSLRVGAAYDMMRGFNRMPRILLAELVWIIVKGYGGRFTFATDLLPSFEGGRGYSSDEEKQYWTSLNRRKDYMSRIMQQKGEEEQLKQKFEKATAVYNELLESKKQADIVWDGLEAVKNEYTKADSTKNKDEAKKYFADVTKASRDRDWAQEKLSKAEAQMDGLGNQLMQKRELLKQMNAEFTEVRSATDGMIAKHSREIELQWKAYFFRFTFDDVIFSTIITTFTRSELLKLEEYQKEMHDSRRPDAYGLWTEEEEQDGKVTKYNGIKCLVSPGKDATVIYSGTYIRKITA